MRQSARIWAVAVLAFLLFPVYTSSMGLIHVDVAITSMTNGKAARTFKCLVDTGTTDSLVPASRLREMGIEPSGTKKYELADGTVQEYPFGLAMIEVMGEITAGRVIFGPENSEPILGVTVLESAGLTIDPAHLTLKKLPSIPLK